MPEIASPPQPEADLADLADSVHAQAKANNAAIILVLYRPHKCAVIADLSGPWSCLEQVGERVALALPADTAALQATLSMLLQFDDIGRAVRTAAAPLLLAVGKAFEADRGLRVIGPEA